MNINGVQAGGPEGPLFSLFRLPESPWAFPADEKNMKTDAFAASLVWTDKWKIGIHSCVLYHPPYFFPNPIQSDFPRAVAKPVVLQQPFAFSSPSSPVTKHRKSTQAHSNAYERKRKRIRKKTQRNKPKAKHKDLPSLLPINLPSIPSIPSHSHQYHLPQNKQPASEDAGVFHTTYLLHGSQN